MTERNPATEQDPAPAEPAADREDPGASPETAGVPEYADDETPGKGRTDDPQRQPMPVDQPIGAEEYGLTAAEARHGEPLDGRLAREEPDVGAEGPPGTMPERAIREAPPPGEPEDPDTDPPE